VRLERISLQAFRGYPSRTDVLLSGNVVLLFGENGTGKTSLTEAFEWALFGSVVRKERSKTRGEYQGVSWLRSVHAAPDVETFAEVTLSKGEQRHVIRRRLVGNATELTIDGKPAADVRVLGLRTEDAFRPFLGQCEASPARPSRTRETPSLATRPYGSSGSMRSSNGRPSGPRVVSSKIWPCCIVDPLDE
jgi:hypothetical protein